MVRPIYLLGTSELRQPSKDLEKDSAELQSLIDDMLETMDKAMGIGLAAPQIGHSERLFVVNISAIAEEHYGADADLPDQPMVFLNATILDESEEESEFEEGCLSIPDVREEVIRSDNIKIRYFDRTWEEQVGEFDGILARVIQHEFDHIHGVLFVDHISPFRRRLIKRKLNEIMDGVVDVDYPTYADGKGVLSRGTSSV